MRQLGKFTATEEEGEGEEGEEGKGEEGGGTGGGGGEKGGGGGRRRGSGRGDCHSVWISGHLGDHSGPSLSLLPSSFKQKHL